MDEQECRYARGRVCDLVLGMGRVFVSFQQLQEGYTVNGKPHTPCGHTLCLSLGLWANLTLKHRENKGQICKTDDRCHRDVTSQ